VGLAERHAASHEHVGDVGRGEELVRRRCGKALAAEAKAREHPPRRLQAQLERVHRVEEVFLVLLEVLVVGQRQPVHDAMQRHQVTGDAGGLGAQQLGGVRVLLLGHQRGARGVGVRDLAERKFLARPHHDLRPQARQMHRAGGGGGDEVEHEVAIGDGVDRVLRDVGEAELTRDGTAVGGEVDAGQRAGAERQAIGGAQREVQAAGVAVEHPEVRQQVVRQIDGLRALEVRVPGHRPVDVRVGDVEQRVLKVADRVPAAQRVGSHEQRHVGGDLVVARARGVQLAADGAGELRDATLDRHVDVLVCWREREATVIELTLDLVQRPQQRVAIVGGDDRARREHGRVRARLSDVIRPQTPVEAERGVQLVEDVVLRL